jgi:predicted nucleic acid-binding protein
VILVDTSVIIDYFNGKTDGKADVFARVVSYGLPFGISAYTYQEMLQGARDEKDFLTMKNYLSGQKIYMLPENIEIYEAVAKLYFNARRKGITPRNMIDVFIAYTCIHYDLLLLHNDRDFDNMVKIFPQLQNYNFVN